MNEYRTTYVHKISSNLRDTGPELYLSREHIANCKTLGARLRDARCLETGRALSEFRVEPSGRIVAFPKGGIWHSIILDPIQKGPR